MDFFRNYVVCDIKVGRCSQLNEYMKIFEYQRSRSFTDLRRRSLRFNSFKLLFLVKPLGWLKPHFLWSLNGKGERMSVQMVQITKSIWPTCPYMVKSFKLFFSGTKRPKLGYSSTTKFVQMITLGWHWPILQQSEIWFLLFLFGEMLKL